MAIQPNEFYHIYNQGNNKQKVFLNRENKLYFLKKFRKLVFPTCEVIAYCLMDNHFHFLIYTNAKSIQEKLSGTSNLDALTDGFRNLTSIYTQALNKQENRSGSLFRSKTKFKLLEFRKVNYPFICFQYIHQNPFSAGLVSKMEDWEFSSFNDYAGFRKGTLCNQKLAKELIGISDEDFYQESYNVIHQDKIEGIL
jgi:REP element-mobilizing transposase RayT|tara:strand:- start:126 stop:713 length:588 start_codon:yes stop_codon:yes gene_type:complete